MKKFNESIIVKAIIKLKTTSEGGRESGIKTGYRPNHIFEFSLKGEIMTTYIGEINFNNKERIQPGETNEVIVEFLIGGNIERYIQVGRKWFINEGFRNVAEGEIIEIIKNNNSL